MVQSLAEDVVDGEDEDVQPLKGRKRSPGNSHSGWCLSKTNADEHERCPVTIGSFVCSCTCAGHGSRSGEEPAWIGRDLAAVLDDYADPGYAEDQNQT